MDISTEVLRKLMDFKILSDAKYRGCLHKFLDDEKTLFIPPVARNVISHARNTHSFESKELESLWIKLSEASLTLTDSPSRNLLKDQISMIKKVEFDSADIETLKEKVEREGEMLEEICKFINQNGVTKDCIKESEGRIVSHINTKTEGLQDDVKDLKRDT
ncbi:unnamed protein product [Mytilus edulis]|uniref:Uncharacterized protein n=1 Tax=Mytilus edulis TaxID=6550 RepID=A0A8S3PZ71_MYTED|nr:unnamed protein product [Mytilus edulis]